MDIEKMKERFAAPKKSIFDQKERELIAERYNIGNVIRCLEGDNSDIGFEREVSAEMNARRSKLNPEKGGITIPYCALVRTLGKTNVEGVIEGNGGALVATDLLAEEYASPLAARLVLNAAGVRFIDGLVGDIAIPKGSNVGAYWITSETGSATKQNPTFSQVNGTPHTVGAYTDISRKLAIQSSLPAQDLIGDLLLAAVARAVDTAGLAGTGTSGCPLGLVGTTGINEVDNITPDAPTYGDLLRFVAALDDQNVDMDALKWLAPAPVRAKLASTIDANLVKNVAGTENVGAVTSARYLCEKNVVADYPLLTSNLCPAKKLILGDFRQLIIGGWGEGIDLLVDRFSNSTSGTIRVVVFKDVDVLVRYPEAFAVGTVLA